MLTDVQLRVVPIELVRPHEVADPARQLRIYQRLQSDGVLRDPLLAGKVADVEGYVLLDGTNRRQALQDLDLTAVLVQVVDYADHQAVQLRSWCHSSPVGIETVRAGAEAIPGVTIRPLAPLEATDALSTSQTLAVLLDRGARQVLVRKTNATEMRASQLRRLVEIYGDRLSRVDCDPEEVEELAHRITGPNGEPATLIAFPPFTRSQVVALAMAGELIPAGITRHIVQIGRALRINLPLETLALRGGLEQANEELAQHLAGLQPRLYREPTILFDS